MPPSRLSPRQTAGRVWLPLIAAGLVGLAGYFGPWVAHRASGLIVSGLDLGEYVKFIPQVLTGQIAVRREVFYLPLFAGSLMASLMASRRTLPRWLRVLLGLAAIPLALAMLPPAWSPATLRLPEFRLQMAALLFCLLMAPAVIVTRYPAGPSRPGADCRPGRPRGHTAGLGLPPGPTGRSRAVSPAAPPGLGLLGRADRLPVRCLLGDRRRAHPPDVASRLMSSAIVTAMRLRSSCQLRTRGGGNRPRAIAAVSSRRCASPRSACAALSAPHTTAFSKRSSLCTVTRPPASIQISSRRSNCRTAGLVPGNRRT